MLDGFRAADLSDNGWDAGLYLTHWATDNGGHLEMNASKRKKTGETVRAGSRKPLMRRLLGSLMGIFTEDIPVSKYAGTGKFAFEVAKTRDRQVELEVLTRGEPSAARHCLEAVLIPSPGRTVPVAIDGRQVGELKPADARILREQQAALHHEPFALHVPAMIRAGKRKKNGSVEFAVFLDLPIKAASARTARAAGTGRTKPPK